MKAGNDPNSIIVEKKGNQIVVSRGNYNSKYNITTSIIYAIEVISGAGKTDIKIKHDTKEIQLESQSHTDWNGRWSGDLVAIEYPNKDLWSEHPVLNELKLTSLVSSTVGETEESIDSNDKSSTEGKTAKRKGNYLVLPNTE